MTVRLLRIHTVPGEEEGSTWLQLFFDLVYVAILVELGNRLGGDLTLQGVAVAGLVWMGIALFAPADLRLWGLAAVLGVLAPLIVHIIRRLTGRSESPHPPIKHHFTRHRFGELTIIVLGEFFIKLVTSSEGRDLGFGNLFVGLCLLGISVGLWWLYFDHLEHASMTAAGSRVGVWLYSHYPFLAAITAYGVVGNKIFAADPDQPLADDKRLLFTAALATAVLAYGAIEWASKEESEPSSRRPQPWVRLGCAAALVALGPGAPR
jgi:low temperature requirement protein LtrA